VTDERSYDNTVMLARPGFPAVAVPPLDGDLLLAASARALAADDFGHLVRRIPLAVLRPGSVQDIAVMTRWASDNGWQIAARGQGHSVYGRSQVADGIVVEMTSLGGIRHVDDDHVIVEAGATWRSILARTLPERLTPPVLTNYLDLSVGGTLSVGGIGGATHKYGMQTDNVLELEVVTGEGKLLTCSSSENSELFNCVRAGLGQFGIITRATLALISAPDRARRYVLAYPDLESLAADQRLLLQNRRTDHLQGTVVADHDRWRYQLDMVVFYSSGDIPNDRHVLSGLADDRSQAQIDDVSYVEYVESFDRFTELLRSTGEWSYPHPWWLTFLPGSTAEQLACSALRDLTADDLGSHGLIMFYPLPADKITTPLVRIPDEAVIFPFNLIRFIPDGAARVEHMLEQNRMLYRRVRAAGATLYPVSAFPLTRAEWEEHYGPAWPAVQRAKERFDPTNSLTPGYRLFSRPAAGLRAGL
jgi:cytokinin dehydrogenase